MSSNRNDLLDGSGSSQWPPRPSTWTIVSGASFMSTRWGDFSRSAPDAIDPTAAMAMAIEVKARIWKNDSSTI